MESLLILTPDSTAKLKMLSATDAQAALMEGMNRSLILAVNQSKILAPVDTGRLRSSLTHEAHWEGTSLIGAWGTNVEYAPEMEYGTGSQGDSDVPHGGRHWPPGQALDLWAARHGFQSGLQVARIIGKRGGLRPRHFLKSVANAPFMQSLWAQQFTKAIDEWFSKI